MNDCVGEPPANAKLPLLWLALVPAAMWAASLGSLAGALTYRRQALLEGEVWRALSGHLVHFDSAHLGMNAAGYCLLWLYARRQISSSQWLALLSVCALATAAGLLLFSPEIAHYGGFSAVLHGALAALCLRQAKRLDWTAMLALALLAAKIAWEQRHGALHQDMLSVPVAVDSHLYGLVGGCLAFAAQTALSLLPFSARRPNSN